MLIGTLTTAAGSFAACEYLSSGDFSSGSGWFVENTDYWSIVNGMLDAHNTGTASTYAKTDFYPDGFFSVDVDIDVVSTTGEHDRVGVMFRTSDSANDLFVVNGDSGNYTTKRVLCYYYPHTGLLKFKVDDVSAGWVVPLAARPVTDHVESIGLSMVPDGVIFRINGQDTNYKLTGNFSFGPSVVVKVLLYAGGTGLHARFDNVCASSYEVSDCLPGNAMPLPTEPKLFPTYNPIEEPLADSDPAYAQPIGTGDIAWGGGTITVRIGTCPCVEPVDLYFAVQISTIPDELYMLTSDGTLQPYSLVGLAPWKTQVTEAVHETPFGDLRMSDLPPGTYYLYLVATAPVGTFDNFYLWSTFFEIPGAPAPTNIKPYLDQVIDDIVIDFGRLDGKRQNLGVGPALGAIPVHPNPGNTIGPQNLCTYINGGTYLKTLPQLPLSDPNHINPDQYPAGMTCVFAVVADVDAEALNFQHILPEPMFGRGNIYTAIPIPGGVPAGTLIDNYETLNIYNSMVSTYANSGLLSVQPHIRSTTAPEELRQFTAPVEPLRTPPQEFPYVIAFSQGGNPNGIPVVAGQTLTETPNPLGLQPSGRFSK